jgi:Calcineurin-like phosphoesterase
MCDSPVESTQIRPPIDKMDESNSYQFLHVVTVIGAGASDRRTTYSCGGTENIPREPITSLLVVSSSKAASDSNQCPSSYTQIPTDLNAGAGGKYIYACITRGDSSTRYGVPLSDLVVTASGKSANICPGGYSRLSQDLNAGAGGDYVFFCTSRFAEGSAAVTDLTFITSDGESCPSGYEKLETDLNSNTGAGTKLYACVEKQCQDLTLNAPKTLQFRSDGTFKLTQFTDSHFGEAYDSDILAASAIYRTVITIEDPDVVVLTGDQVSGYAWDGTQGWFAEMYARVLDTILSLGYPYFYLNGNHDPQADLTQREIMM